MTSSSDRGGGAGGLFAGGAPGIDELAAEARQLSRDQFAARFPHLFLLIHHTDDGAGGPVAFETEIADPPRRAGSLDGSLRVVPLTKAPGNPYADRVSIGRARNCDVVLRYPSVSKLHAHVRQGEGGWSLTDEESQNGTSLNRAPLAPGKPAALRSGDAVAFGTVVARVADAGELHDTLHRMIAASRG